MTVLRSKSEIPRRRGIFFRLRIAENRYHHVRIHNSNMKNGISQTVQCRRALKTAGVRPDGSCGDIEAAVESGEAEAVVGKVEQTIRDCLNCQRKISALSGSAVALGMVVKSRRMLQSKLEALPRKS